MYARHMTENDQVVLKVPQLVSAQKIRRSGQYIENETYLAPEIFTKRFYEPANEIPGPIFLTLRCAAISWLPAE